MSRLSVLSILCLTFYAMLFSMISTYDKTTIPIVHKDLLAFLSVFMSSFTVTFSVYEWSKKYDVRSENFLRSARAISEIRDRLNLDFLAGRVTWEKIEEHQEEYTAIMTGFSDNHGNIDFAIFRANIGRLDRCARVRARIMSFFKVKGLFLFTLFSPAIIFSLYSLVVNFTGLFLPPLKSV